MVGMEGLTLNHAHPTLAHHTRQRGLGMDSWCTPPPQGCLGFSPGALLSHQRSLPQTHPHPLGLMEDASTGFLLQRAPGTCLPGFRCPWYP